MKFAVLCPFDSPLLDCFGPHLPDTRGHPTQKDLRKSTYRLNQLPWQKPHALVGVWGPGAEQGMFGKVHPCQETRVCLWPAVWALGNHFLLNVSFPISSGFKADLSFMMLSM